LKVINNICQKIRKMLVIKILTAYLMHILYFKLINAASINEFKALKPLEPSEPYTHSINMDEDDESLYKLFWKILNNDEIQFEIHCRTTGWVGLGFSPNGNMEGKISTLRAEFSKNLLSWNLGCLQIAWDHFFGFLTQNEHMGPRYNGDN
jgi:hypothetical protein